MSYPSSQRLNFGAAIIAMPTCIKQYYYDPL
jgi:hypothetical protein